MIFLEQTKLFQQKEILPKTYNTQIALVSQICSIHYTFNMYIQNLAGVLLKLLVTT